jgi:hypothetical protein
MAKKTKANVQYNTTGPDLPVVGDGMVWNGSEWVPRSVATQYSFQTFAIKGVLPSTLRYPGFIVHKITPQHSTRIIRVRARLGIGTGKIRIQRYLGNPMDWFNIIPDTSGGTINVSHVLTTSTANCPFLLNDADHIAVLFSDGVNAHDLSVTLTLQHDYV